MYHVTYRLLGNHTVSSGSLRAGRLLVLDSSGCSVPGSLGGGGLLGGEPREETVGEHVNIYWCGSGWYE
jgi:hypothetical protein